LPLEYLVVLVVVGISGVVLLTKALGWARPAKLSSADEAINHFCQDHPELTASHAFVSDDNSSALIRTSDNTTGLVFSFGDKFVTRRLTPEMVDVVTVDDRTSSMIVKIALSDYTAPAVNLIFDRKVFDASVAPVLEGLTDIQRMGKNWR
jgi:hypothetical protein